MIRISGDALDTSVRRSWVMALVLIAAIVGCGDRSPLATTVSGRVMVAGQPLSGAVITFEPTDGTTGPKASTIVLDGSYAIEESAELAGGRYRIRIAMLPAEMVNAIRQTRPESLPAPRAVIRPEFDSASELYRRVSPNQPNTLDFQVEFLTPTR